MVDNDGEMDIDEDEVVVDNDGEMDIDEDESDDDCVEMELAGFVDFRLTFDLTFFNFSSVFFDNNCFKHLKLF